MKPAGGMRKPAIAIPAAAVVVGTLTGACVVGAAFVAAGATQALSVLLALLYVIPALLNLPLAVVLWAPTSFLPPVPFIGAAPTIAALLIIGAWLPTLRDRNGPTRLALRMHGRTIMLVLALIGWVTLSLSWAKYPDSGMTEVWQWWFAGAAFVVVVSTVTTRHYFRLLVAALFVGAVIAAVLGFMGESLSASSTALELPAADARRLGAFLDDPNYLAAGLVTAIVLGTGLFARGRPGTNLLLTLALVLLTVAFAATESRGALIAAGIAVVGALVVYSGRRAQVVVFLAMLVAAAAVFFASTPDAWQRMSEFDSSGNGRSTLWTVAWRMTEDHPVAGVGLGNFQEEAARYVRQPGSLELVRNVAEHRHVTHNVYLQYLAETGFVGLGLLLLLLGACVRAGWRAAKLFDERGDPELAALARACLLGLITFAAASAFISNGSDVRFWILFALGPVAYGVAQRMPVVALSDDRPPMAIPRNRVYDRRGAPPSLRGDVRLPVAGSTGPQSSR